MTEVKGGPSHRLPERPSTAEPTSLQRYFNRELSWLRFNSRVLEEALDSGNRLLERVRFLSIFANNLDEFFMVRVSGLRRQLAAGVLEAPPDGMTPAEQLAAIRQRLIPDLERSTECWRGDLLPSLSAAGVQVVDYRELEPPQRALLRRLFEEEIFPVLTPLAFDPAHPFPHISNLTLSLAVVVQSPSHGERFARLKVPQTFPRLLPVPDPGRGEERLGLEDNAARSFVWLEQVVAANLDLLFPGLEVVSAHPFRVTRDADFEIEEDEAADLMSAMAEVVGQRHFGSVVRLEVDEGMPEKIRETLIGNLELAPYQVFTGSPLGLSDLAALAELDMAELRDPPFLAKVRPSLASEESCLTVLGRGDLLLYHPYDSFSPVVQFVREAAADPEVLAIKQTLYRVGPNSPIVEALKEARENGKQVSVLVELKARFDEERNIVWARELEAAGVHVVYGLVGLKTHAKMCLVVRREGRGIRRFVHLSTGNYNAGTARVYVDLGYFTCDEAIADDVSHLFNALTGYSLKRDYRKLIVAPGDLRHGLIARIERETEAHRRMGGGRLIFKMNALVDRDCIDALYEASSAGVKVDLLVRGICCLRPGVEGLSENISVSSVVGRFLEHARIYYFRNGGDEEVLSGSADLMPRNLDGRVEVLYPIEDPKLRRSVRDDILGLQIREDIRSWVLGPDGEYRRLGDRREGREDSQRWLLEHGGEWQGE